MKFVIHIGANKTGSTLLQEYVMPKLSNELAARHIYYSNEIGHLLGMHVQRPAPQAKMAPNKAVAKAKEIAAVVSSIKRKDPNTKCIIVSREKFFGNPRSKKPFDNIGIIASDIKQMLEGHDVKIVAYVRRQDTYIESNYQTGVKMGSTDTFDEFTQRVDIHGYRWDELLDQYAECFGKDNLYVFPYEDLLTAPDQFYRNFLSPLQSYFSPIELPVVNPGLTSAGLEKIRQKNFELKTKDERKKFRATVEADKQYIKQPHESFNLFSDDDREALLNTYADSNARLFNKYIKRYGYIYNQQG